MALIALLVALASAAGGFVYGRQQGVVAEAAKHDKQAVQDLATLIDSHKSLIAQAATASKNMRAALGQRATQDAQSNKEFKDALFVTADSRAGCVFSADVMRQLAAASERAAQAAAGGIHHPLPGASAGTSQP